MVLAPNQLAFIQPLLERAVLVLGLTLPITLAEIKSAYRSKAKVHHPDKGGDVNMMMEIVSAYELLIGKTKVKLPPPQEQVRYVYVNYGTCTTDSTSTNCW